MAKIKTDKNKVIYRAKDYNNRSELDAKIYSDFGDDFNANKEKAIIKGHAEELKNLQLSETSTIFGVEVMV